MMSRGKEQLLEDVVDGKNDQTAPALRDISLLSRQLHTSQKHKPISPSNTETKIDNTIARPARRYM